MNIVNVMWAGGSPYMSVHKVHRQILGHADAQARITNWLLIDSGICCALGDTREWHMPQRALKGRHLWRLLRPWLRMRLRRGLEELKPDILLLDGLGVARLVLPVLRHMPDIRVAILFHGSTRLRRRDMKMLSTFPAERLSVAAVSRTLASELEGDLQRPVQTLRIALDPHAFGEQLLPREQARHSLGLVDDDRLVFGAVGRLTQSKGFEMLIEAFARARQSTPGMELVILGDGSLRAHLEARINALGIAQSVRLIGHRPDMAQLYRAFDWLLVPSRSEGLGLVIQEAVHAGVPVICSDLPVFREQLGEAGRYLPCADSGAWVQAISQCSVLDPVATAERQHRAIAPEQAWIQFKQSATALFER